MANKKYLHNIDMVKNELQNALIHIVATDPVAPTEAQFWYNSTSKTLNYYDGVGVIVLADMTAVEGLLDFKGGYDAATNTPDLDNSPSGVKKGDVYVVTAAGNFFTEAVEVGDTIYAKADNADSLVSWVIVQTNIEAASETVAGIVELATAAETTTGTDDVRAITPLKLQQKIDALPSSTGKFTGTTTLGSGASAVNVAHNLGQTFPSVHVYETATNKEIEVVVTNVDSNNITLETNGAAMGVTYIIMG